jgi:hypothetical protein
MLLKLRGPATRSGCTYSGAEFTSKKTLISAQNLENKGLEFSCLLDLCFLR